MSFVLLAATSVFLFKFARRKHFGDYLHGHNGLPFRRAWGIILVRHYALGSEDTIGPRPQKGIVRCDNLFAYQIISVIYWECSEVFLFYYFV